jgi:hypothetical protein
MVRLMIRYSNRKIGQISWPVCVIMKGKICEIKEMEKIEAFYPQHAQR